MQSDADDQDLIDILTPKNQIRQCNFSKLSLSQTRKNPNKKISVDSFANSRQKTSSISNDEKSYGVNAEVMTSFPDVKIPLRSPSSKSRESSHSSKTVKFEPHLKNNTFKTEENSNRFLKVRSLTELISPNIPPPNSNESNEIKTIIKTHNENEIFTISSDDESKEKININTKKLKQINRSKTVLTTRKKRNQKWRSDKNNEKSDDNGMPLKTSKIVQDIKTEIKKITVQRRLTKSTNLKRFSAKYLSPSQQKIDAFFKPTTNDTKVVKYYETFDESKPQTVNITEETVTDYLEIAIDEINRIKEDNSGISKIPNGYHKFFENDIMSISSTNSEEHKINVPIVDKIISVNPTNISKVVKESLNSYSQSSSRRKQYKSDSTSLEFNYKSLPSEKTESVDYAPLMVDFNPPLRRSKRQNVDEKSVSAITEKIKETSETVTRSKRAKIEKKSNQNPKSKVRKRLNFRTSIDSEHLVPHSNESNPLPSSLNSASSNKTITDLVKVYDLITEVNLSSKKQKSTRVNRNLNVLRSVDQNSSSTTISFDGEVKTSVQPTNTKQEKIFKSTATKVIRTQRPKSSKACPDYKIIKGTTFAVDAFRFGYIDGITHYFLTHFHADHYIGLKKSFTMPIYLSEITARLVSIMIGTDEQYLKILELNETIVINNIQITVLDANHCPGAIMLHFRLPDGKCILHTGDFRASFLMESEPIFWNYSIHTIYLDTTYLSCKYAFKSQNESLDDAVEYVRQFNEKHIGEKTLIVCGTYVIGKEKVWMTIAEKFHLTVWMDGSRKKTIQAINNQEMLKYLNDDPLSAEVHVIPMNKLSYDYLWQYLNKFSDYFDVLVALRPSGWEKNSKPQYRGKVNIIGIEYSEHSSYDELRRFVRFLQPNEIISTVPNDYDLSKTTKIPKSWFKNDLKRWQIGFQSSMTNFVKLNKQNKNELNSVKNKKKPYDLEEAEEIDGVILDATRSNFTISTPTKSNQFSKTQKRIYCELSSPHKTIATTASDWMS